MGSTLYTQYWGEGAEGEEKCEEGERNFELTKLGLSKYRATTGGFTQRAFPSKLLMVDIMIQSYNLEN